MNKLKERSKPKGTAHNHFRHARRRHCPDLTGIETPVSITFEEIAAGALADRKDREDRRRRGRRST